MNNGFEWWLIIVGIGLGAALLWLVLGRLPRRDDDIGPAEQRAEADWISHTIEAGGGVAPVQLVEEVLDLHHAYLEGPALLVDPPGQEDRLTDAERPIASPGLGAPRATPLALSVGDGSPVQRNDPRRQPPETDLRQPG